MHRWLTLALALPLSLGLWGCSGYSAVIRSEGPRRSPYHGDVELRFLDVPPNATEIARVTVIGSGPDIRNAIEPLLARTADVGGNLAKIDEVVSEIWTDSSTDSQGKTTTHSYFTTKIRGRALYFAQAAERRP